MPRNFKATPNSYESITRPVAMSIARELVRILELPPEIKIELPGGMEQLAQPGSTLQPPSDDPSNFQFVNRLHLSVDERFKDENVLSTTVHYNDAEPIFHDPLLNVRISPVYSQTLLTFTIGIRAKDRDMARKFRDTILARSSMLREAINHECNYSFTIPTNHLFLLQQVHTMREAVAGYGEDFSTWVSNHLTPRATNLVTQAGTEQLLVVQEHQTEMLGWFDWAGAPDQLTKDSDAGTYVWEMTYTASYDKVIGCAAKWPIVVHNQMMPEPWIGADRANGEIVADPDRRPRRSGRITAALQHFIPHLYTDFCARRIDGVQIPVNDEFIPEIIYPDTSTVFLALMAVDLTAPRYVMNLAEGFEEYTIDPDILTLMSSEYRWLTTYQASVFHLSLYRDGVPLEGAGLMVDEMLNVSTREPMDPRCVYHLRLALVTDLSILTQAAVTRFRSGGVGAQKVMMTLQWKILGHATIPQLKAGRWLTQADLLAYTRALNATKSSYFTGLEYRMLTVGNFLISMHRRNDDARNETHTQGTESAGPSGAEGDTYPIPQCGGGYPV